MRFLIAIAVAERSSIDKAQPPRVFNTISTAFAFAPAQLINIRVQQGFVDPASRSYFWVGPAIPPPCIPP